MASGGRSELKMRPSAPPIALPAQGRGDLLDLTLEVFQPRTDRVLTREDAREMVENVTGLFGLLAKWERKARGKPLPGTEGDE